MKLRVIPFLKQSLNVWIPFAVTATAIVLTFVVGRSLERQEQTLIEEAAKTETFEVQDGIESGVNELLQLLSRAAERWNRRPGGTPRAEWEADSAQYFRHFVGFQSFERVDRDYKVQWNFPSANNESVFEAGDSVDLQRRFAFETARDNQKTTASRLMPMTQGGKGFFICAPVYQGAEFDGFLVASVQLRSLLNKLIHQRTKDNYSVSIIENGEPIFEHDWKQDEMAAATWFKVESNLRIAGSEWTLQLKPKPHTALLQKSMLDEAAVAGGLIMSVMLGLLTSFSLQMKQQAKSLKKINETMAHEIEMRNEATEKQKEVEEALRRSENLFRVLTTNSPVGIFQTDAHGDCLFVNERWTELTGIDSQRALGKGWVESLHVEDREFVFSEWYKAAESGSEFSCEYRFQPRGEITVWVAGRAIALRDENHNKIGYIGTVTDITKSKIIEQSNRLLLKKLEDLKFALDESAIVAVMDENGKITNVNDKFCEISGCTPNELRGETYILNADYHTRESSSEVWETIRNGKVWKGEVENRRKDGLAYWVDTTIVPFLNDQGESFQYITIQTDITDRKLAEVALRESEDKFRAFMDNLPLGAWILDEQASIRFQNKFITESFGVETQEAVGKTAFNFFPKETAERLYAQDLQVIGEARSFKEEFAFSDRNGEMRELLVDKFPIETISGNRYVGGIAWEVTEQRRAENALRESEERFRVFMDSTPAVAFMKDEDGYYHFLNKLMSDIFQVTTENMKGKTDHHWLPETIADNLRATDLKVLQSGESLELIEAVPTPEGETRFWLTLKFPFINRIGKKFVGGVAVDITDRQLAEENLAQSLAEKETLLKEVHHRVKNNLQIIASLLNMQIRRLNDTESTKMLINVKQRVQTMSLIHEKLYQSGNFTKIDLGAYLKNLTEMVFQTYEEKMPHISLKHECELVNINVEKGLPCGLIVNELVSNSLKYAFSENERGSIWIRLSAIGEHRACLEIGDSGRGLPPDFEPEKARTLGLKLVKSLVQQLDGELEIARCGGTVFKVTFDI